MRVCGGIDGEGSSDVVMEHVRKIRAKLAAPYIYCLYRNSLGVRVPMEGLKNMGLKRCFFLLSVFCLVTALLLTLGVYLLCGRIAERYPQGGIAIDSGGTVAELAGPDQEQMQILELLDGVRLLSAVLFPAGGLGFAGILFYRLKLKAPIEILKMGTGRIRSHDLDFSMPEASADELGQICAAFEMMRKELLETNRKLWQQAEERKRLNAAFAHDLRNPVTVLKGSVKLMKGGRADEHMLERMERYVLRVEQYVEAMSGIQRLEQIQVRLCDTDGSALLEELEETAHLLAPELDLILSVPDLGIVRIDHGIFLTVAENLIGNAARFACRKLEIRLTRTGHMLCLMVADDGPGFPPELVKNGPKPFGKMEENAEHFGMGLYSSQVLCGKHGGELRLENRAKEEGGGARIMAVFGEK